MNIKQRLNIGIDIDDINFFIIPDARYKLIKKVFRIAREKPKDKKELFSLYISIIKHITTKELIITTRGTTRDNKNNYYYKLNDRFLKYHLELNAFSNKYFKNIDDSILQRLEITRPLREKQDIFIDDGLLDKGINLQ